MNVNLILVFVKHVGKTYVNNTEKPEVVDTRTE